MQSFRACIASPVTEEVFALGERAEALLLLSCVLAKDCGQLALKQRQVSHNGSPDQVLVDVEIGVNQTVSRSNDRTPGNRRRPLPRFLVYARSGLPDNLDALDLGRETTSYPGRDRRATFLQCSQGLRAWPPAYVETESCLIQEAY